MMQKCEVILVRHGVTEWNDGARFQGQLDSPLTRDGILQAEGLGARLKKESVSAVYSSDLGRAVQTASIICAHTGHTVITDERLRERCLGVFQGLRREEVERKFPDEWKGYCSRDPDFAVTGGQSVKEHFDLGFSCLNELAARHPGKRVVVVSHGGMVQALFRFVTGVSFREPRKFSIQNAAYNLFSRTEGRWYLETWGDISHFSTVSSTVAALKSKDTGEVA